MSTQLSGSVTVAAQGLYESGYCTYIRTDSVRVSDEALEDVRKWLADNKHNIPKKPNLFKNKEAAQDAHECIRPSDLSLLPKYNFTVSRSAGSLCKFTAILII